MDLARIAKHALDRLSAWVLLALFTPLLAVIAIAIRVDSPGSPLFLQERAGAGGRPFTIFKFRTMRQGSEKLGLGARTALDDDRITRVGRFLRATSLDELPQLVNVALGEMSFVGPRPTLRYQVDSYTPQQRRRLLFRPGITGWAQIHGRNEIPWERRIELDLQYIDHYSLGLDFKILLRTLQVLVRREGVYAASGANDAFAGMHPPEFALPSPGSAEPPETRGEPALQVPVDPEMEAFATPSAAIALGDDVLRPRAESAPSAPPVAIPTIPIGAPDKLPLLIIGAGGHARVAIDVAERQGRYRVVGLVDDRVNLAGTALMGYPVLGGRAVLGSDDLPAHAFVAIGAPTARAAWQAHLEDRGFQLAVLVHPSAQVGRETSIGAGSVLMAGTVVNSGTQLGRGVIVNTGASIDHDCEIGDFVHVAPGARLAGGVRVGTRAHVGIGACVLQNLELGDDAVVGGGAAVVRPVPAGMTVVGVPARPLAARTARAPQAPAAALRV